MKHKKNSILRFIFSLLPGAGEMYMGFMKMGVNLMVEFITLIYLGTYLYLDLFYLLAVVIWFYSFFNVHNIASLPDEEFYLLEDGFATDHSQSLYKRLLKKADNKTVGIFLVFAGFFILAKEVWAMVGSYLPEEIMMVLDSLFYNTPKFLIGIAIILLGFYMIRGKKKELDQLEIQEESEEDHESHS